MAIPESISEMARSITGLLFAMVEDRLSESALVAVEHIDSYFYWQMLVLFFLRTKRRKKCQIVFCLFFVLFCACGNLFSFSRRKRTYIWPQKLCFHLLIVERFGVDVSAHYDQLCTVARSTPF